MSKKAKVLRDDDLTELQKKTYAFMQSTKNVIEVLGDEDDNFYYSVIVYSD